MERKVMKLKRSNRRNSEMEVAVQRLLGSNVKKQTVNVEPRNLEAASYSLEIKQTTDRSRKKSQSPNISHKKQKKVKPKKQSEESFDELILLAHSLAEA